MDLLAHAVYGATACSRTGLAGGRNGAGRRWYSDWTVWCASVFGILPDLLSMGFPFIFYIQGGMQGHFFRDIDTEALEHYRYAHSLLVALLFSCILRLTFRSLFFPSLAWSLHILMDAFTHGTGRFHTTLFYPLSEWHINGISYWRHPEVGITYWAILPVVWLVLWMWRRRRRTGENACPTL